MSNASATLYHNHFCPNCSVAGMLLTILGRLPSSSMHATVSLIIYQHQSFTIIFTARGNAKRGICRRRVSVCVCVSVCVSVCLSVTLRYCIKTAEHRITQTTPHDSPMTLVFSRQRSWRNSNGITPYGGDKCRWGGLKLVSFDEKRAITRKRYKIDV